MSCQCGCGRLLHLLGDPYVFEWTPPRMKIRLHYWPHVSAERPWCAVINAGTKRSAIGNLYPTAAEAIRNAWDML